MENDPLKVVYFVHNVGDPAVARRVDMLIAGGAEVSVIGFQRGDQPPLHRPGVAVRVIGVSHDARMLQRAALVARACAAAGGIAREMVDADVIIARNLEMLVVASAVRGRARSTPPLVYECLDIHRLMLGEGRASRALRALERRLMKACRLLIVSSPGFLRNYFEALQTSTIPTLLVENKLLRLDLDEAPAALDPASSPPRQPWRIGWFGMIRCQASLDFLCDLAKRRPGLVEIDIRGLPSLTEFRDFDAQVRDAPGVAFHGRYERGDLARHYGGVHFAWAIDFFEQGQNSDWLLPNRLYESLAHGVPPIALAHVETGRWLTAHHVGVTKDTLAAIEAWLVALDSVDENRLRNDAGSLDPAAVIATRRDCKDMVARLAAL